MSTKDKVAIVAGGARDIGQAGEVADLVAYLGSPASSFVTGASVDINGGMFFS